jgi:putative oxidoreductase
VRAALAVIIGAHGWARWLAGGVPPFGGFLDSLGLPGGIYWAGMVTALEVVGSLLLLVGRWVAPLAVVFSFVYLLGIITVHAREGWFVVGLGRNGSEFSVLIIVALLALALQHVRSRHGATS